MPAVGRRVRAARRHRRDLHPPRQERPRRHLHLDLGRADRRIAGPQARRCRWSASIIRTARRSSPTCSAARCGRRSRPGCARAGCAACCRWSEIRGQEDPDEFLLVHGHYDSWYEGIGDNATGDAALLELARVLWGLRDRLKRTRADRLVARPFHRPLRRFDVVRRHLRRRDRRALHRAARHRLARLRRCHGLRGSDVDGRGRRAVPLVDPGRARPALDSACGRSAPATTRSTRSARPASTCCSRTSRARSAQRRGYYAVGGCGGNIAWHTVDDLMPVADLEILRRDLMVYLTTIVRIVNAPLHPFDYAAAMEEMRAAVARYQEAAARRDRPRAGDRTTSTRLAAALAASGARDADAAWPRRLAIDELRRGTERGAAPYRAAAGAAQLRQGRALRSRPGAQVRDAAAARARGEPAAGAGGDEAVRQGRTAARDEQGQSHVEGRHP